MLRVLLWPQLCLTHWTIKGCWMNKRILKKQWQLSSLETVCVIQYYDQILLKDLLHTEDGKNVTPIILYLCTKSYLCVLFFLLQSNAICHRVFQLSSLFPSVYTGWHLESKLYIRITAGEEGAVWTQAADLSLQNFRSTRFKAGLGMHMANGGDTDRSVDYKHWLWRFRGEHFKTICNS